MSLIVVSAAAWRALTDPAELERWFAFCIQGKRGPDPELRIALASGELPTESGVLTCQVALQSQRAAHLEGGA